MPHQVKLLIPANFPLYMLSPPGPVIQLNKVIPPDNVRQEGVPMRAN
jgi:hypothetical protein